MRSAPAAEREGCLSPPSKSQYTFVHMTQGVPLADGLYSVFVAPWQDLAEETEVRKMLAMMGQAALRVECERRGALVCVPWCTVCRWWRRVGSCSCSHGSSLCSKAPTATPRTRSTRTIAALLMMEWVQGKGLAHMCRYSAPSIARPALPDRTTENPNPPLSRRLACRRLDIHSRGLFVVTTLAAPTWSEHGREAPLVGAVVWRLTGLGEGASAGPCRG